ncbi:hypothetical protein GR212_11165 [Rhizobium lusitanum]|uniref:Uncharacterized protein n=1 Tax=Rhizobium lusitanum TaxID=293958 RepID=A0A6L9U6M4_9HYPH|nr:hypothetical protein [Rhizobium lusitanum]NEI70132.1 hypothetical protein [Rhizobium lusitanum]
MTETAENIAEAAKSLCDRLGIPADHGTVFAITDEIMKHVLAERERCATIAERGSAALGATYGDSWSSQTPLDIAIAIRMAE